MTSTDFADAVGYTLNHVSQIELGNRNAGPKYLRKAADLFGCEISDITAGAMPRSGAATSKPTADEVGTVAA